MWQTKSRFSERPNTVHEHLDSRCLGERSSIAYPEVFFVRRNEFAVTGSLSIPSCCFISDDQNIPFRVPRWPTQAPQKVRWKDSYRPLATLRTAVVILLLPVFFLTHKGINKKQQQTEKKTHLDIFSLKSEFESTLVCHCFNMFQLPFYARHQFQEERPEGGFAHAAPPISRHRAGRLQGSCLGSWNWEKVWHLLRESCSFFCFDKRFIYVINWELYICCFIAWNKAWFW